MIIVVGTNGVEMKCPSMVSMAQKLKRSIMAIIDLIGKELTPCSNQSVHLSLLNFNVSTKCARFYKPKVGANVHGNIFRRCLHKNDISLQLYVFFGVFQ